MNITIYGNELYHHGVKGQKWGERQYQNEDGSLTPLGREHYGYGSPIANRKAYAESRQKYKNANKNYNKSFNKAYNKTGIHLTKSGKQKENEAWDNAIDKADYANKANAKMKTDLSYVNKDNVAYAKNKGVFKNVVNLLSNGIYAPAFTAARAGGKSVVGAELKIIGQNLVSSLSGAAIGAGAALITGKSVTKAATIGGALGGYVGAYTSYKKNSAIYK